MESTNSYVSTTPAPDFGQVSFKTSHKCDMLSTDNLLVNQLEN